MIQAVPWHNVPPANESANNFVLFELQTESRAKFRGGLLGETLPEISGIM
jgi:hypothetical protein